MKKKFTVIGGKAFKDKNGREMIVLNGAGKEEVAFLTKKQMESAGYKHPLAIVGNIIEVEFYAEGDKMFNEAICTKAGIIAKNTVIHASADDVLIAKAVGYGMSLAQLKQQVSAE